MTDTLLIPQVGDPDLEDGEPILSHIVAPDGEHKGHELVLLARIEGTPVTALCGKVWVPSRDPKRYPVCAMCAEIAKSVRGFDPDGIHD